MHTLSRQVRRARLILILNIRCYIIYVRIQYRETKKGKLCVSFREKKKKITRPFRRLTRGGGALAEAKDNIWGDNTTSAGREISGGLREEYYAL